VKTTKLAVLGLVVVTQKVSLPILLALTLLSLLQGVLVVQVVVRVTIMELLGVLVRSGQR
jgi:hypothetical protein